MGENMGMTDEQLLKYIRENLEKYTANPNNLGGGAQVNGAINGGRDKAFKNYKYRLTGYQYSAILDDRTTETCRYLDGKTIPIDDPQVSELSPPNHWNCRSILVPITATDEQPEQWTGFQWGDAPAEAKQQKNL
jgi:SPP1 gp7 family putative phage head morphogenesis protein